MYNSKADPCPVCETKKAIQAVDLLPEDLEQMARDEHYADAIDDDSYKKRISICNSCKDLQMGMTCGHCGCFVQFRAMHKTAHCVMEKW